MHAKLISCFLTKKLWGCSVNSESKETFSCHRCPEIKCLNLSYHPRKHDDTGHELYIYKLLGKKMEEKFDELKKYVCRNGTLLQSTCFLVDSLRTSKEESFLKIILDQSTRDLKASMFLAFSGHYRQAMQVLRCSFENLISGVYFHSDLCELRKRGGTTEEFKRLEKRFNEWEKGGRVNIRGNIEVLRRIGFLSLSEEKSWRELYRNLSKFIHTPKEYICRMKHKEMANIESLAYQEGLSENEFMKYLDDKGEEVA